MSDWAMLASSSGRREFSLAYGGWFLIGESRLSAMDVPSQTVMVRRGRRGIETTLTVADDVARETSRLRFVCPVRKVRDEFRQMITVGRTANNDVVLADRTVSRFHAYFREVDETIEIADAGSRNATRVNGRQLAPRQAIRLFGGERLRLGAVDLTFVDAPGCWDFLQRAC